MDAPDTTRADYESTPLARSEYIAAIVHLYRGELYRANSGRIRLDNTTNWAVLTTAGLLTFSFGEGRNTHWILLIGLVLVSVFLVFEQRRFRIAEVWRMRVRMIEENFYGPILRRDPVSPDEHWGDFVAEDLYQPREKITRLQALRARLARNYLPLYGVLLLAWSVKLFVQPTPAETFADVTGRLGDGLVPWWVPIGYVCSFLLAIASLLLFVREPSHDIGARWQDGRYGDPLDA